MNLFRQPTGAARAVLTLAIVVFASGIAALQRWTDVAEPAPAASAASWSGAETMPAATDVTPEHDQEMQRYNAHGG